MAGMEMRESMYNILICDDEKDIVNALKIYLNDTNYHFWRLLTVRKPYIW